MTGILTKPQRRYLSVATDWCAVYEILERLGKPYNSIAAMGVRVALGNCVRRGWAQWSASNNTYRITDKGREVLK